MSKKPFDIDEEGYYWCSVDGDEPEPCYVKRQNPYEKKPFTLNEYVAITIGCKDPFYLERPKCPLILLRKLKPPINMAIPESQNITISIQHNYMRKGQSAAQQEPKHNV